MTPEPEALSTVYQEVCKGHAAIADFRAKLLALLPIASAGGIGLLLKGEDPDHALIIAIGVFGLIVTFGLFLYELRGVQDCVLLRERAETLESMMHVPENASQFADRGRGRLNGLVDEIGAGLVIYPAVMAAWAYVATYGAQVPGWIAGPILAVAYLAFVVAAVRRFMQTASPTTSPDARRARR